MTTPGAEVAQFAEPVKPPTVSTTPATLVIRPSVGWPTLGLRELVAHRELMYFLVWRDVKIRYKQTAIGVAWAVIQPVFTMVIFTVFFGRLAKVPSDGVPYALFAFTGLVPWTFFANGLGASSNSLVGSANLITKVYFPRLIIPLSSALAGVVDLFIALVLLFGMLAYYHVTVSPRIALVPAFALLGFTAALGVGLWLSAVNVQFRDVRHAVPFLTQIWMYASPIVYPASLLPSKWRTVYAINPMVGVVEGFRWALLHTPGNPSEMVAVSSVSALLLLASGLIFFRRMEKGFADIV